MAGRSREKKKLVAVLIHPVYTTALEHLAVDRKHQGKPHRTVQDLANIIIGRALGRPYPLDDDAEPIDHEALAEILDFEDAATASV